ncbi:MAG: hypothetical protein Q4C47_03370 [Planctomycetia bacterium]|nr:hypothetical protein [Planctomycetia bacterium]
MTRYRRKSYQTRDREGWFFRRRTTRRRRGSRIGSKLRWTVGLILTAFFAFIGLNDPSGNTVSDRFPGTDHTPADSSVLPDSGRIPESSVFGSAENTTDTTVPSVSAVELTTEDASGSTTLFTPTPLGRLPESVFATVPDPEMIPTRPAEYLNVCSFNIQFLGNSKKRENASLAEMLSGFDLVLVQEMVAPPREGTYPDGTTYPAGPASADFTQEMTRRGFAYIHSEEDTGGGPKIHSASSSTEWWIAFYRPDILEPATDLPGGFLDVQRAAHPVFQRVPYAFPFRTRDGNFDFVLISVHLYPEAGPKNRARRAAELDAIARTIEVTETSERQFLIVGDMNIQNIGEIFQTIPRGYMSLNAACVPTNTMGTAPFDHVVFIPENNPEVDCETGCVVISLIEEMRRTWSHTDIAFPGDPYDHDVFRQYYSDHNPIAWRFRIPAIDSD